MNGIFLNRGLHFLHLNINSLLPSIDELRHIARLTNAAVIGIPESKLDDSVSTSEIQIDEYDLLPCDRNRHGGGELAISEMILVVMLNHISLKT